LAAEGSEGNANAEDAPADIAIDPQGAMQVIQATYPRFNGRQDWMTAMHHCHVLVDRDGVGWHELMAGVERYAAFVSAGGVSGSQYVMTPAKFFSGADKPWSQEWTPPPTKAQQRQESNIEAGLKWLAQSNDS